jgi:pimeloyl-ACP methyl ester carboxylesterase
VQRLEPPLKETTLLLLPGLDGTDVFLKPLAACLPPTVRPVIVPFPDSRAGDYATLLKHVRETAAPLREFHVLGSSFSGPLAVMLAAAEPERVRGIILAASFVRSPRPRLRALRFAAVGPVIWALRLGRRVPVWLLHRRGDPFRKAKAETWSKMSATSFAARVRAVLAVDVRESLRQCPQPLLCVSYAEDNVVPRRFTEEAVAEAPRGRLVTLPGKHNAMCRDPQPLAQAVVQFLREQETD